MFLRHGVKRLMKLSTHLAIGAIIGQLDEEGKEYVITYAS
jgi:hypothetical protein